MTNPFDSCCRCDWQLACLGIAYLGKAFNNFGSFDLWDDIIINFIVIQPILVNLKQTKVAFINRFSFLFVSLEAFIY